MAYICACGDKYEKIIDIKYITDLRHQPVVSTNAIYIGINDYVTWSFHCAAIYQYQWYKSSETRNTHNMIWYQNTLYVYTKDALCRYLLASVIMELNDLNHDIQQVLYDLCTKRKISGK